MKTSVLLKGGDQEIINEEDLKDSTNQMDLALMKLINQKKKLNQMQIYNLLSNQNKIEEMQVINKNHFKKN
jgi:hypothetical protein